METLDGKTVLEIVLAITGTIGSLFALLRYNSNQQTRREEQIMKYNSEREHQMLEYFEKKNNHLERISNQFSISLSENTKALSALSTNIQVMNEAVRNHR